MPSIERNPSPVGALSRLELMVELIEVGLYNLYPTL